MARTIEKIEYDLEHRRRERDAWKYNTRGGKHNDEIAKLVISALEKKLEDTINDQGNPWSQTHGFCLTPY